MRYSESLNTPRMAFGTLECPRSISPVAIFVRPFDVSYLGSVKGQLVQQLTKPVDVHNMLGGAGSMLQLHECGITPADAGKLRTGCTVLLLLNRLAEHRPWNEFFHSSSVSGYKTFVTRPAFLLLSYSIK